jgi:anti-sigma B factor antagonist
MITIKQETEKVKVVGFPDTVKKLNVIIAEKTKLALNQIIDSGGKNLIIDFSNIEFIDSSGFGALVTVHNHAKNIGSKVMLCQISNETMELLTITKLDQVFHIYSSVDEALANAS